ncbi:YrrS family protein [Planococcus sp. N028]|uniref:YrrS family protein n=1 Tax=Planococcus shixiaomingii TaxID=3058393 RepID=A0ABT8MXN1_9BACL|nr:MULTISPECIES: YrrS family protein [unclassified Planococcus (in: firmicutes)]MDN7240405.1 YrrS family protein [Planococcus sp. N028]WKA56301.1 YrrS family protein [Planococcus sp. N022]
MSTNDPQRYPSRLKKKKNRSNSILNGMIGLVFALIVITGAFIFLGDDNEKAQELETVQITTDSDEQASETDNGNEETNDADKAEQSEDASGKAEDEEKAAEDKEKEADEEKDKEKDEEGTVTVGGTITRAESKDPIVEETVINTSWEPVKTTQKGEHVSVYDKGSVDWKEKVKAITYATGLKEDNMYIMRLQNGGGPQKSVGVVQSKDQKEKYRVHLEWIDGEGWKPVKMDILKTLEGAY